MAEVVGIKETLEALEGAEAVLVIAKKVAADGKVNLSDLPVLIDGLQKASVLTAAVKGIDGVVDEAKDLSFDEGQQILARVKKLVQAVKAA